MNFEDFWIRLSPPERKIMPEYFARYIWNSAQSATRDELAALEKKHFDNKLGGLKYLIRDGQQLEMF